MAVGFGVELTPISRKRGWDLNPPCFQELAEVDVCWATSDAHLCSAAMSASMTQGALGIGDRSTRWGRTIEPAATKSGAMGFLAHLKSWVGLAEAPTNASNLIDLRVRRRASLNTNWADIGLGRIQSIQAGPRVI